MEDLEETIWQIYQKRMQWADETELLEAQLDAKVVDLESLLESLEKYDAVPNCDKALDQLMPQLAEEDPEAYERIGQKIIEDLRTRTK